MSDLHPFGLPQPPLMSPAQARDVARGYKSLADHFDVLGVPGEAARMVRHSNWWLAYAVALEDCPICRLGGRP